jgi:hypothetical protein
MQAADARKFDHSARGRWFDGARDGCISAERHMGSVLVVIGDVLADQAEQMPLAEHHDVVEQFAAQRAHPSFGESVLPWRPRRDTDLPDAQVVHPRVEFGAEDGIGAASHGSGRGSQGGPWVGRRSRGTS